MDRPRGVAKPRAAGSAPRIPSHEDIPELPLDDANARTLVAGEVFPLDDVFTGEVPTLHESTTLGVGDFDEVLARQSGAGQPPVYGYQMPVSEPEEPASDQPTEQPADEAPPEPTAEDIAEQEQAAMFDARQKRKWHQRRWLRVLMVLAALVGITAIIPYPLRITSECQIIPRERVKVRSEISGVIAKILVDEGQWVKKGDIIAQIDDRALQADLRKAQAEVDKIDAELAILQKGHRDEEIQQQKAVVAARRTEAAFAAKEAVRRKRMQREGVGSVVSAEEARRDAASKSRAVAEAEAGLRLLVVGARPEELQAKEAVRRRAKADLSYIEERIAMAVIKAPIDGEILTPRFREHLNENVELGGLVCEIANTRRMRAEIMVPEREIDTIERGMSAVVKVESYPTHGFEGKVDFIAPAVNGEDRNVRVVVEIENEKGMLKSNMTGYGEIEVGSRSILQLATRRLVRWVRVRFLL